MPTDQLSNCSDQHHGSVAKWPLSARVLFRFTFCYLLLYAIFGGNGTPVGLVPGVGAAIDDWLQSPMDLLAQWTGHHLFHLTGSTANLHIQATGDGALRWVAVVIILAISSAATLLWSFLDAKRVQYVKLLGWSRFFLRLALGVALLKYGFIKVFPIQFPSPSLAILNEPVGNTSATTLFWTVYGLNPAFMMAMGWTEVVAGLLLMFRRTAFAGTLLAAAVMANVALLDLSFDVPVKLYSLHLLTMALALLAPEMGILADLFFTCRRVSAGGNWSPETQHRARRWAVFGIELAVAILGCTQLSMGTWQVWRLKAEALHNPASITGEWQIDSIEVPATRGSSHPRLAGGDGQPITTIYFDANSDAMLRGANGTLWRTRTRYDRQHHKLTLLYAVTGMRTYTVTSTDANHLTLTPQEDRNNPLSAMQMTRVRLPESYPLLNREFHWVNDWEPLR